MSRQGHAALALLKLVPLGVGGYLLMGFAFQQAAAAGEETLWLAVAAVVPLVIAFSGWAIRDSGNLRELTGRFSNLEKKVDKIDDAQERIFRELGGAAELRNTTKADVDRLNSGLGLQDQYRHNLRNELSSKILDAQETVQDQVERLEERLRAMETAFARQQGAAE